VAVKSNYDIAKSRVKKKNAFHKHLATYLAVCTFLVFINLFSSPGYFWAMWPILGWGISIVLQGISVYGVFSDRNREESMIQKEMDKMDRERSSSDEYLDVPDDPLELRELEKRSRWNDEDFV